MNNYVGQLVFGLDIGTRSIVGIVGYKDESKFIVTAMSIREHKTRAMLDGQIHDIHQVALTISEVKEELEDMLGISLRNVCIAAAGRVLKTINVHVEYDLGESRVINEEDVYTLNSIGVEKAYETFINTNNSEISFYCVGNSVIKYYMGDLPIANLIDHKTSRIGADLIATFLPNDVVDGLYKSVELANLNVINMTLEPIAAIGVAIPEKFRLLNLALVDVGAGTTDICITKDGSIVAYGMIPVAGDSLTEVIAHHCLVDFITADDIKKSCEVLDTINYVDIMGLSQSIDSNTILSVIKESIDKMTSKVSDKIMELNGGKPVSAVFVVGGGGRISGYSDKLANNLGISNDRVAIRGEDVMSNIDFNNPEFSRDSLMITPIGIALSFYEGSSSFIHVSINGKKIKLYDNLALTIMDAAISGNFPTNGFFPKRGRDINYYVNSKKRICKGELGEVANILLNGVVANLNSRIRENDIIVIRESSAGADACISISELPEYESSISISVLVNNNEIMLPRLPMVNEDIRTPYYSIQDGDNIVFLNYITVGQIIEYMDVTLDSNMYIYVNNKRANHSTKVYDNFSVIWTIEEMKLSDIEIDDVLTHREDIEHNVDKDALLYSDKIDNEDKHNSNKPNIYGTLCVVVNGDKIVMSGKSKYIFVDIFDYIDFDLSTPQGVVITNINGRKAEFMEELRPNDVIEIYWDKLLG